MLNGQAMGFIKNSFYTGLSAIEIFFNTMEGRGSLVDTVVCMDSFLCGIYSLNTLFFYQNAYLEGLVQQTSLLIAAYFYYWSKQCGSYIRVYKADCTW